MELAVTSRLAQEPTPEFSRTALQKPNIPLLSKSPLTKSHRERPEVSIPQQSRVPILHLPKGIKIHRASHTANPGAQLSGVVCW